MDEECDRKWHRPDCVEDVQQRVDRDVQLPLERHWRERKARQTTVRNEDHEVREVEREEREHIGQLARWDRGARAHDEATPRTLRAHERYNEIRRDREREERVEHWKRVLQSQILESKRHTQVVRAADWRQSVHEHRLRQEHREHTANDTQREKRTELQRENRLRAQRPRDSDESLDADAHENEAVRTVQALPHSDQELAAPECAVDREDLGRGTREVRDSDLEEVD